jgi:carbamate kinase
LIIPTAIDHVYLDYGTPASRPLTRINLEEAKTYLAQGKFEKGSILPKIEAAVDFLSQGGERVIITSPENLGSAVEDSSGTHIVP